MLISLQTCGFADWDTKEICGFAICELIITGLRGCKLRTGTPQEFADLRLQNEPKTLRINKTNLRAHLWSCLYHIQYLIRVVNLKAILHPYPLRG
jgi:hypothetical protein